MEMNEAQKNAIMAFFRQNVEDGEEVICENGHQFHAGKYDFCPICFKPLRTMTLEDLGE